MFDFSSNHVADMEATFAQRWPGGWRRLSAHECGKLADAYCAGWLIDLPRNDHGHPLVGYGWVLMDKDFPLTDLRVAVPEAAKKGAPPWPHVENEGLLCLTARPANLTTARRLELAVSDAVKVLQFDDATRTAEFEREFLSYWNRRISNSVRKARSIIVAGGQTRDIVYTSYDGAPLFADDDESLRTWLGNLGISSSQTPIIPTRLIALPAPLVPAAYPVTGADILALDADGTLASLIKAPAPLPVLLEGASATGQVFACTTLQGGDVKVLRKGFRSVDRVPASRIVSMYAGLNVQNRAVIRHDAPWVHGRDHDPVAQSLMDKSVAMIGCGALGSEVAKTLAAAGVGQFYLVDGDRLMPENTSRHALGAQATGQLKAGALAAQLNRHYPHMKPAKGIDQRFEMLNDAERTILAQADLVVTAGLSPQVSLHVGQWLAILADAPDWMDCWTEEFACAGHSMAFLPGAPASALVDQAGRRLQNFTSDWPPETGTIIEAGCGTAFQPYSATDLLGTTAVSTRLALDLLLGKAPVPSHRAWLGDRALPIAQGASVSNTFDASFTERRL